MNVLQDAPQGSAAWHAARVQRFCASEAAAALGVSKHTRRAELLRVKATGITPEVTPDQQRLFDRGHAAETAARQWAEAITGEELAPVVATLDVDGLPLLASFDGIDFMGEVIWENKLLNQSLIAQIDAGELEPHYHLQIEHQLLVSGATRCLFTASDGTEANTHSLWYESRPERRAALIAGWKQFAADLAAYVPTEPASPVVATPTESLPAVVVQVQGALTVAGNLPAFGQALRDFIARIPAKPATDQQFANCDAACKALRKAEDALTQAEDGALAQISDVEVMRRTVADLKELARSTRLATEKLVKAEKDARRTEKVMAARQAFEAHVACLQVDIKGVRMIVPMPDFGGAIKGLSSLASIDDKLTAALIACQAEVNALASKIINNLRTLDSVPAYAHLFADRQELAYKDAEVLELLMQKRVDAEQERIEAERQRIRAEEERKAAERHAAQQQSEAAFAAVAAAHQENDVDEELYDPDCAACLMAQKDYAELERVTDDLAALVRRLARSLRKAAPDHDLPSKALDYLARNGLQGSPLRDGDAVLATIEADDGDEAQKLGDLRMALAYAIDPYKREGTLL